MKSKHVVVIGDALVHTNAISGRGCTLAWLTAYLLADALRDHAQDPLAFARQPERSGSGTAREYAASHPSIHK